MSDPQGLEAESQASLVPMNVQQEVVSTITVSASATSIPNDLSINVNQPPVQPTNISFPPKKFGKTCRSLNSLWYKRFPWIEYSVVSDKVFCYSCRFFSLSGRGRAELHGIHKARLQ